MEIKLSENITGNIIYENIYHKEFETEEVISLREEIYKTESYCINLKEEWFNGIHVNTTEFICTNTQDFIFKTKAHTVNFLFCLEGSFICCSPDQTSLFSLEKNEQSVVFGQYDNSILSVNENVKFVHIQLTEAYYYKLTNENFNSNLLAFKEKNITAELGLIIYNIISNNYSGRIKRLFLESKIRELIIYYFNKTTDAIETSLNEDDIGRILLAKNLVEENLQKPCSLIELSRKVGINDYKLKKGFKELTGNTVFGYLYKIRMEKAYSFLSKEKKSVNEVSFLVGYKNAQHFIAAFKKQYNISPGTLNKMH